MYLKFKIERNIYICIIKLMNIVNIVHRLLGDPVDFYRRGVKILIPLLYKIKYHGFENIPETGPAILICNHVSYMDGLIIDSACKRKVRFIIDENIYNVPGVKYFMGLYGAIPIQPNRKSVERALGDVSRALKNGDLVCIFPEGQLTYTGNMSRFRFGIEWMIKNDPVPIVPIALKGLWGSIFSRKYRRSRFRWFPRSFRRRVALSCGKPIYPNEAKVSLLQRRIMHLKNDIELK